MDRNFGGVIWTNHALARLRERNISQSDAWSVWRYPDQSRYASTQGGWVYYKTFKNQKIEVVAKQNEKKEWIILSVWSKAVYPGMYQTQSRGGFRKDSLLVRILKKLFGVS